jgi:hypothetical protein
LLKGGYVSEVLKDLRRGTATTVVGVEEGEKYGSDGGSGAGVSGVGSGGGGGAAAVTGGERLSDGMIDSSSLNDVTEVSTEGGSDDDDDDDDGTHQHLQQQQRRRATTTRRAPFETANTLLLRHISTWVERKLRSVRSHLKLANKSDGTTTTISSSQPDEAAVAAAAAAAAAAGRRRWALFVLLMVLAFLPVKRWRTFYASK